MLSFKSQKIIYSCISFFIGLLFLLPSIAFSQQDSCHLRISLLTCTPGEELYSTFGHSALRVSDTVSNTDIVYNYGTFNFDEPGFYTKFIRGKLMYFLSTENVPDFQYAYQMENRGITEQVLNLSCSEKVNIVKLLQANLMSENKFYKYDFLFDNCTTRLRDLVENTADSKVDFRPVLTSKASFRDLIYEYLNYNDKQWSKLGIDILLGARTDAIMNQRQVMFLPDYLMKSFDNASIGTRPLVAEKDQLTKVDYSKINKENLLHPFFIFLCLFVLIAFLSFSKNVSIQKVVFGFDAFLVFVTGFLGVLILFMWFGTDHLMCKDNYNLLWAWPANFFAAFFIHSRKRWAQIYFLIYAIFLILVLCVWFFLPQHFNVSLIPVILILILRSFIYISKKS